MKKDKQATPSTSGAKDVAQSLNIAAARQQFFDAAINMGWQLAVTIIVPVIIGVKLDDHYHTTPAWTLGALFLAVAMACAVVGKTMHGITLAQSKTKTKDNHS